MHAAAREWIGRYATDRKVRVLDVGGRDINGSPRDLFPNATRYLTVDLLEHASVDIVGDILTHDVDDLEGPFDIIVYAEVAEHTPDWAAHIAHLYDMLDTDGLLVITAASLNRRPHSGVDGAALRPGEWYENIDPQLLADELYQHTDYVLVDEHRDDVRAMAARA